MEINQLMDDSTYSAHEDEIMNKWENEKIYQTIIEKNKEYEKFRFMDGPPFVSSNCLHFGHLMIGFLKSTILNYKQMNNMNCLNELGYDCHGLPIEMVANKKLGVNTKKEVEEFGIDKYNSACKDMIKSFSGAWTPIYQRIGRWANFNKTYKTMDTNFMESVWWVFAQLYKKDLIYKGFQVMPYSNACNSPLSNFEAGQAYKDIETRSIYVNFQLLDYDNTYIIAWTTTPWTLPGNLALCINSDGQYDWIEYNNKIYICGQNFTKNLDFKNYKVLKTTSGKELIGLKYKPVFDYMNEFPSDNKFTIVSDNYVSIANSNNGTGIVHLAPFYGEDDFKVCEKKNITNNNNIEKACTIDENGKFLNNISEFANKLVTDKDTNDEIIKYLKINGSLIRTQMYTHSYPFCYRTDTPLIYKVTSSYFVKVPELKDNLLANNDKVTWHPANIGTGRFKSWLENVKDWCVSRNRFFGTPLPIWVSDDGEEVVCISSIDELVKEANLNYRPSDLHRETIDNIVIPSKQGKGNLKNVQLTLDCWFESGCVPIAQIHYPFENSNAFDEVDYLSDFIAEGLDQTRGWFYTLSVISTAIFNKPAFKNVICTGLILDENGIKFSKKYGNFKDPMEVLNKYGADVTRLYLLNSPTINADFLHFNESSIEKVKQRLIPYINGVKLFLTQVKDHYSKGFTLDINKWKLTENIMDKWMITYTSDLISNINQFMENYKVDKAIAELLSFVEDLTNWYIKLNRDRIRGLNGPEERSMSLSVLYQILITYIKIMAPFTPFLSEYLYSYIKKFDNDHFTSIHLYEYPKTSDLFRDQIALDKFNIFKEVIKNIRVIRNSLPTHTSNKIPIYKTIVFHNDDNYINSVKFFEEVIKEETNCVEIEYNNLEDNLTYKIIPNLKTIGKKFRSDANLVKEKLMNMSNELVYKLFENNCKTFIFDESDKSYEITSDDYTIERVPAGDYNNQNMISKIDNEVMISIDKRYTEELHNIYQMRRLVTLVQRLRKSSGLNPWNKIHVNLIGSDIFSNLISQTYFIEELKSRLLCKITVNEDIKLEPYAISNDHQFEFFNNTSENISANIYLI